MDYQGNPMNKSIKKKYPEYIKKEYPVHIKEEGANHIKYYNNDGVEVEYPADRSGRLKSQDDYKKIKEDFININEIDENTLDGQNKLKNFQRYVKGPLTGQLTDRISNFFSSNKNSVPVGGRRKSKKTKRKSLKRGRKTRRKLLKKRKRTRRKSRRKVRR